MKRTTSPRTATSAAEKQAAKKINVKVGTTDAGEVAGALHVGPDKT
jgi:hypothetical protein